METAVTIGAVAKVCFAAAGAAVVELAGFKVSVPPMLCVPGTGKVIAVTLVPISTTLVVLATGIEAMTAVARPFAVKRAAHYRERHTHAIQHKVAIWSSTDSLMNLRLKQQVQRTSVESADPLS